MNAPRLSLLVSSVLVVPIALVIGAAGAAAQENPGTPFGSHVSSCAQGTGFTGQHNPSHHRGPAAHDMDGTHC